MLLISDSSAEAAQSLLQQKRWAEAKLMTEFVRQFPNLNQSETDAQNAERIDKAATTEIDSNWSNVKSFAQGMATGEPHDMSSMLGSLSLDLFVIGDVRDLVVQGWKQAVYGNGDKLILALSAVGLVSTLAPELDWAPALMKGFRKMGALSERFVKSVSDLGSRALTSGNYSALGKVMSDFGSAAKHLGPGPLAHVMKTVDTPLSLGKLSGAAAVNPAGAYGLVAMTGKTGVKRLGKDGANVAVLLRTAKTSSRLAKSVYKFTDVVPAAWLGVGMVAGLLLALLLFVRAPMVSRRLLGQRQS
ncbi:MAG: hypothetical protein ACNYPI_04620 [Arenicellales bacterium WSBS_2016_MAG_OTU3]